MIYCLYIIQKVVVLIIDFKRGDAALQTINRSCCIYIIYIYAGLLIRIPCQMTFVLFSSNTTGVINGAGTANSNGVPEFVPRFSWVCFAQSLVFCVVLCVFQIVVCTFVPLLFGVVSVLRFVASNYTFGQFYNNNIHPCEVCWY